MDSSSRAEDINKERWRAHTAVHIKHKCTCVGVGVDQPSTTGQQIWPITPTESSFLVRWMSQHWRYDLTTIKVLCSVPVWPIHCVMHKLSGEVTDKPSRRVACWVIASVTQYQHRKLRNATHVSAQKQPSAADGREPAHTMITTMIWHTLLTNAACKHNVSTHTHAHTHTHTHTHTSDGQWKRLDQCHLPWHC